MANPVTDSKEEETRKLDAILKKFNEQKKIADEKQSLILSFLSQLQLMLNDLAHMITLSTIQQLESSYQSLEQIIYTQLNKLLPGPNKVSPYSASQLEFGTFLGDIAKQAEDLYKKTDDYKKLNEQLKTVKLREKEETTFKSLQKTTSTLSAKENTTLRTLTERSHQQKKLEQSIASGKKAFVEKIIKNKGLAEKLQQTPQFLQKQEKQYESLKNFDRLTELLSEVKRRINHKKNDLLHRKSTIDKIKSAIPKVTTRLPSPRQSIALDIKQSLAEKDVKAALAQFKRMTSSDDPYAELLKEIDEHKKDFAQHGSIELTPEEQKSLATEMTVIHETITTRAMEDKKHTQSEEHSKLIADAKTTLINSILQDTKELDSVIEALVNQEEKLLVEAHKIQNNLQHMDEKYAGHDDVARLNQQLKQLKTILHQLHPINEDYKRHLNSLSQHITFIKAHDPEKLKPLLELYEVLDSRIKEHEKLNTVISALNAKQTTLITQLSKRLKQQITDLETKFKTRLNQATVLGVQYLITQDEKLKQSKAWRDIVQENQTHMQELKQIEDKAHQLKQLNADVNLSRELHAISRSIHTIQTNASHISSDNMPVAAEFKGYSEAAKKKPFVGLQNPVLIDYIMQKKMSLKPDALIQDLVAVNNTIHEIVSDDELKARLKKVGIVFAKRWKHGFELQPLEIIAINRMNKQLRLRNKIKNPILRDLIQQKNIYLKSKEFFTSTESLIKKINAASENATSDHEMQQLLTRIGITDITANELTAIQHKNQLQIMSNEKEKLEIELQKRRVKESVKFIKAVEIATERIIGDLNSPALSPRNLYQSDAKALQVILSRLQNDLELINNFIGKIHDDMIYARNLQSVKEALEKKISTVADMQQISGRLIITTDPKNFRHHLTEDDQRISYHIVDLRRQEETPYEFSQHGKYTLSYAMTKSLAEDKQVLEIIAYQLFHPGKETAINEVLQQQPIYLYGPETHAKEMAIKLFRYARDNEQNITIYINNQAIIPHAIQLDTTRFFVAARQNHGELYSVYSQSETTLDKMIERTLSTPLIHPERKN